MLLSIADLPEQICFEKDGFIYCNWTRHPRKPEYGITGDHGGWIKFQAIEKNKQVFWVANQKKSPAFEAGGQYINSQFL